MDNIIKSSGQFKKYQTNFPDSDLKRWIQIIEMEKECRGYSYATLAEMLAKKLPEYAGHPDELEKEMGDRVREQLKAKKPDSKLIGALLEVMEIKSNESLDEDVKQLIVASRYKAEVDDTIKKGDTHWNKKKNIPKFQDVREKHERIVCDETENGILFEEAISEMSDESIDVYNDYIERQREQMKKKLMYMCDYYEKEIIKFLEPIEFDEEDMARINNMEVNVTYSK